MLEYCGAGLCRGLSGACKYLMLSERCLLCQPLYPYQNIQFSCQLDLACLGFNERSIQHGVNFSCLIVSEDFDSLLVYYFIEITFSDFCCEPAKNASRIVRLAMFYEA